MISKTVRGAFLLAEGAEDRKLWLERRLEELSGCSAVEVAGFAVLDNHLHLLVRLCPERSASWSDEEVVRRWRRLFPPRGKDRKPVALSDAWVRQKLADAKFVASARRRLADLGWFMKCLNEPLARIANRSERCQGHFWQGRFKSIAVLDTEALLAVCAYIDYLELVDWTSRLIRRGKARLSAEVASILDRLGTSAEVWQATMSRLFARPRVLGVAFAFQRRRLQEAAARRGCHHLANLNGCPT